MEGQTDRWKPDLQSQLEYVNTILDPSTKTGANNVEAVQRCAAKLCQNDNLRTSSITSGAV